MADEMHPVVLLLAARKKSHPEEFEIKMDKMWDHPQEVGPWHQELALLGWYLTEAEKELLYDNRRDLIFERVMGRVMSKLLRGVDND